MEVTGQYDRCEERAAEAGLRRLDAGTKRTVYTASEELVVDEDGDTDSDDGDARDG